MDVTDCWRSINSTRFGSRRSQQQVAVQPTLFVLPDAHLPCRAPPAGEAAWGTVRVEQVVFKNSAATETTRQQWGAMPLLLIHGVRFDPRPQTGKPLGLMTNLPLAPDRAQAGPYPWDEVAQL